MLWYKSWLETRARFQTSLITLTLFSAVFVYHAQGLIRPQWTNDLHRLLFVNQQFLVIMWTLSAVLLAMGGIVREKSIGTSSLTLALPVTRLRLMASRIGVGLLEATVLGTVPWLGVVAVLSVAKKPLLISQVTSYAVLLVTGGLVFFAMGILVSSLVSGEYTAPSVAFGILLLVAIVSDAWLRDYSVWRLITGDLSIDRSTFLLPRHLPWLGILVSLVFACLMLIASVVSVRQRDF